MAVVLTCDKCGCTSNMEYATLKARRDVGRSPFGELYIPCNCGGKRWAPYRIIKGQIAPTTNGFEDHPSRQIVYQTNHETNPQLAFYKRMMGGF